MITSSDFQSKMVSDITGINAYATASDTSNGRSCFFSRQNKEKDKGVQGVTYPPLRAIKKNLFE